MILVCRKEPKIWLLLVLLLPHKVAPQPWFFRRMLEARSPQNESSISTVSLLSSANFTVASGNLQIQQPKISAGRTVMTKSLHSWVPFRWLKTRLWRDLTITLAPAEIFGCSFWSLTIVSAGEFCFEFRSGFKNSKLFSVSILDRNGNAWLMDECISIIHQYFSPPQQDTPLYNILINSYQATGSKFQIPGSPF